MARRVRRRHVEVYDPAASEYALAGFDAANKAQASEREPRPKVRGKFLRRAVDLLTAQAEDFALLMTPR